MALLSLAAYYKLVQFEVYLARDDFGALHHKVRTCSLARKSWSREDIAKICRAVDIACIWYWKQTFCLQRSAATTCLLKQHGIPAQMVIGGQQVPFRTHAWVEVDGQVVNDKPYMRERYAVLDLC